MTPTAPDPRQRYPLPNEISLVFLNTIVTNPHIEIGDYTFYHDFDDPLGFEQNVRYIFPFEGDRLSIGHDVWIGCEAPLLAGITVGHGAVIGAKSVVTSAVPPYAIMAGNPARVVRYRQPPEAIARLLDLAWWNWPIDHITRHVKTIASGDVEALTTARCSLRMKRPV